MRRILGAVLATAAFSVLSAPAQAQVNNAGFSDPFFLYYGWYLPRQAALAAQPGPEVAIQQNQFIRQQAAVADRSGLYSPPTGIGFNELNSPDQFAGRTMSRMPRSIPARTGINSTNITGAGHASFFNRTSQYYPTMRSGRSRGLPGGRPGGAGAAGMGMGMGAPAGAFGGQNMNPLAGAPAMPVQSYGR
jgi:hypothetical protein